MALQSAGQMSFADVYNEMTGESLSNPPISITLAELGQLQNSSGQQIALNELSPFKPSGTLPTVFPDEWYRYCQTCGVPQPFLQISKASTPEPNAGDFFNFLITVTNNGEASTNGNIIITDIIPDNIIISSVTGNNMTYTVANQLVTITYSGGLAVGQSVQFFIIVKTFFSGTFQNQASVIGGGDSTRRFSNTTTTVVSTATYTATKTERRDRTVPRNNCGDFGTGSFVQVWSPFFTNTYTSYISQADADAQATNLSVTQANSWLNANAQNVANQNGTCGFQYPDLRLLQTLSANEINRFQTTSLSINIKNFTTFTSGTITLTCALPAGLTYSNLEQAPPGWSFSVNGNTITMSTSQQLSPDYNEDFRFTLSGAQVGTYIFNTTGVGGNIANSPTVSNSLQITIYQEAVYSVDHSSFNLDFVYNGNFVKTGLSFDQFKNAVPGDTVGHNLLLTINNSNTGTDQLRLEILLPSHITSTYIGQLTYNTFYFSAEIFPLRPNVVVFKNKVNNIPIGQYLLRVEYNLPLDYYSMNTVKSLNPNLNNNTLVIFETGQSVPCLQKTIFYFFKNFEFIVQKNDSIRWFNNYRFKYEIRLQRNPYAEGNTTVKLFARDTARNEYLAPIDEQFSPLWDQVIIKTIIFKDPTRGTDHLPLFVRTEPYTFATASFDFWINFYTVIEGQNHQVIYSNPQYSGNLYASFSPFNLGVIFRLNGGGNRDLNNFGNLSQKAYNIPYTLLVKSDGKYEVFPKEALPID